MGHSEARMTALYTVDDLKRRRAVLDQMAERLLPGDSESPSFLEAIKQGVSIEGSKSNG